MKELYPILLGGLLAGFARILPRSERMLCPAIVAILIISCHFASSQSLDEINKREAAVAEAWEKTPLTVRRALFVTEEPKAFGIYTLRWGSEFEVPPSGIRST